MNQQMKDLGPALDALEKLLVTVTLNYLKREKEDITEEQARNLVSKIGLRISYGSKIFDEVMQIKPQGD